MTSTLAALIDRWSAFERVTLEGVRRIKAAVDHEQDVLDFGAST